jgi:ribonuclease G
MAKNLLVISVDIKETRVALIESGIIAELHIERSGNKDAGSVGDVVLGRVTRVLPGLQAAFIDIGQERAAFLHVEDLIRPDDFDTYLAGGRKQAKRDDADVAPGPTSKTLRPPKRPWTTSMRVTPQLPTRMRPPRQWQTRVSRAC